MVSISACHAEDPGSIPGGGVIVCTVMYAYLELLNAANSISGLVVEYIVGIDVTRVRFPADACFCGAE